MKKILSIFIVLIILLASAGCVGVNGGQNTENGVGSNTVASNSDDNRHVLVAVFSATGKTKQIADSAAKILNADLYVIVPEVPYTEEDISYSTESRSYREQHDSAARPAIAGQGPNMDKYDTILIGYPIWYDKAPRIINTFLESRNFDGKAVAAFCTSDSSGIEASAEYLHTLLPENVKWLDSRRFPAGASEDDIRGWLNGIGLTGRN
ncbi:MAG: hypothetical protein II893_08070 [Methanomicrobium sp.]|nr:hypothetical protein [Methanomicrobium sp.]